MNHVNESVEQIQRPLMTPDEVMRIRPAQKKGEGDKQRIVGPGDMLIFVSGQYPILGKQMRDALIARGVACSRLARSRLWRGIGE